MRYNVKGKVTMNFSMSVEASTAVEAAGKADNEMDNNADRFIEVLQEHARNLAGNLVSGSGKCEIEVIEKTG